MEAGADDRRDTEAPAGALKAASFQNDDAKATSFTSENDDEEGSESEDLLLHHGGDSTATPNEDQGGGGNDAMSRLRKEKRLAMNRESARNRRKRKKMLIESLEAQVAKLKSSNQQYQLTTESMSAKVRGLENDLAVARATIRQLTGANNHPTSLQQQHHQPQLMHQLSQQQQQQFGTTDFRATMDADRLRQAQLQQLVFLQGGGGGSGVSSAPASTIQHMPYATSASGVAGLSHSDHDMSFLRQQQLLAAQQATNRDRAIMLQSNMSRSNNAGMGSPNTHPNALLNTLATQPQPDFGLGDSRLLEGEMLRLPDALAEHQRALQQHPTASSSSLAHQQTNAPCPTNTNQQQQILEFEEFLLRQQEQEQQQQQRKSMG